MSLDNQFKVHSEKIYREKVRGAGDSYILYDAGIIDDPTVKMFAPAFHFASDSDYHTNQQPQQNNSSQQPAAGIGRARVVYFQHQGRDLVLKHYYRGGAVARFMKDCYLGRDVENSRAFREWRLLKKMRSLSLPVPDAVAAHVQKKMFCYRADLITEKVADSRTLADILSEKKLSSVMWSKVGACISLFHRYDIYHADLNARNILLTGDDKVYLLDFDNSYMRAGTMAWKRQNIARLKRSLLKFTKNTPGFNFDDESWAALLAGYR